MKLIAITNAPDRACLYERAGVDRIMVDLEIKGKVERQGHLNTLISRHQMDDVAKLRGVIGDGELMVRTNPLDADTEAEVDAILARGADRLMLPMFRHPDQASRFLDIVAKRAPVTLLVETAAAFARLPQLLELGGDFDIHIGLNDLHLEYKLDFMFELFSSGLLDHAAQLCKAHDVPFGVGGIARVGQGLVPAEMVVAEHIRLGSTRVILSRDFSASEMDDEATLEEVEKLRQAFSDPSIAASNVQNKSFTQAVQKVVMRKRKANGLKFH